jgi:uncharacterized membrane protein
MPPLSGIAIQRRLRAVERAIAQQRLEGLRVPAATVKDLRRAARGEIEVDEVLHNIRLRMKNVQVLGR